MIDKSKLNGVERDLVEGLEGFVSDLRSGVPLEKKYTCRRVVLDLVPRTYDAEQVRATRELLNASQVLFASFLGVSVNAVRKWEQGSPPGRLACRMLDEIQHNPEYFRDRIRSMIRVKSAS